MFSLVSPRRTPEIRVIIIAFEKRDMKKTLVIILVFSLLIFGCSQTETFEESTVEEEVPEEPETLPQKTYECPDGTIVTDLGDCSACPESCDDGNPCTNDSCS